MKLDFKSLTLSKVASLVRQGDLSPVEVTQAYLDRIQRANPSLNCFITISSEQALEASHALELALEQGAPAGLLAGVPMGLKDLFETQGIRTTAGSTFFRDFVPVRDCHVVKKLKSAGAIVVGKMNLHEIALGVTNVNPHFGACRNPWDLERVPGGSSGGSASALAAGLCLGALGTDTGGSIRIPSSLCGTVGLKPTLGRVSLNGVFTLSWNLDHAGPMARTVEDVALLLQVIAGYDPDDPTCHPVPVDDYLLTIQDGVKGWRIALTHDEYFHETHPEVESAIQAAGETFSRLGAQVEAVPFPEARLAAQTNGLMTPSDAAAFHHERLISHPEGFGEDIRRRLQFGASVTSGEYIQARRTQVVLRRQFERFFDTYDLLLTPTTPIPAPLVEGPDAVEQARWLTRFTSPFNLTGLPALSLPCGFTTSGLPIGLQFVARHWGEARLLQGAYAYEQASPWLTRWPGTIKEDIFEER